MRNHFGLKFGTFASKALLLQAAVIAHFLRISRVDNITTLRTGQEEVWNEIYFQRKKKRAFQIHFQCATANPKKIKPLFKKIYIKPLLRTYTVVHRPWQKDIACGDCIQDRDSEKREG